MKKILALLLASMLVAGTLAACNRNKPEPEPEEVAPSQPEVVNVYTNGDYSLYYTVPALDRTLDFMTVSFQDDVITIKDYGMKESEDMPASGASSADASSAASSSEGASSAAGTEHEATAAESAKAILAEFERAGQDVDEMEVIEDAEEHSYRFMRMMRTALLHAAAGDTTAVTLGKYADGSYESVMPSPNADGWKEYVKVAVTNGEVVSTEYNAMKGDDPSALITADEELNKAANKPSEYYPQITKNFLEGGDDLTKLLSPTGGGEATKTFIKLMTPLLNSMASGGDTKITASRYKDGEYKAQFKDFDETGWKEYVVLEIKSGVVTVKEFDAISKDDETKLKSKDGELASKMEEKTGINFGKAVEALLKSWQGAGNDVTKVDNVAGATVSSNSFKLLVGQILATTAIEGDNANTLEIERFVIPEPK